MSLAQFRTKKIGRTKTTYIPETNETNLTIFAPHGNLPYLLENPQLLRTELSFVSQLLHKRSQQHRLHTEAASCCELVVALGFVIVQDRTFQLQRFLPAIQAADDKF